MGDRIQKFNFLNVTVRGYVVLLTAKHRGYVTFQDVRRLYALSKRSKRAEKFLKNMVKNGLLEKRGDDQYVLTAKSEAAIRIIQEKIEEAKMPSRAKQGAQLKTTT